MTDIHLLFDAWGIPLIFLVAFAEFIGLPVAAVPLLVIAGGLGNALDYPWLALVMVAFLGGFIADYLWFRYGRSDPARAVDVACGLSSNPRACTTRVQRTFSRLGPAFIVRAKLLPGSSNLIAVVAGLEAVPGAVFLPRIAVGGVLWSALVITIGWVLRGPIEIAVGLMVGNEQVILAALAGVVLLATVWRVHKMRTHASLHVRDGRGR